MEAAALTIRGLAEQAEARLDTAMPAAAADMCEVGGLLIGAAIDIGIECLVLPFALAIQIFVLIRTCLISFVVAFPKSTFVLVSTFGLLCIIVFIVQRRRKRTAAVAAVSRLKSQ
jgi:hypothetical protein